MLMTSSVDIVSLTNSAAQALEAAAPDFSSVPEPSVHPARSLDLEPEPVRDTDPAPVITVSRESPESPPVIVEVVGTISRHRDRTLSADSSASSASDIPPPPDSVRIVRAARPVAPRQKLASRKQLPGPPPPSCPQLVVAAVVPKQKAPPPAPPAPPAASEPSQQAALLSAATSAAAAAAVGTQPVLKDIEVRIARLADKMAALETARCEGASEQRLRQELEVQRELVRAQEGERRREEARRARKDAKFQQRLLALAAMQQMQKKEARPKREKQRLLEQILSAAKEEKEQKLEEKAEKEEKPRRRAAEVAEARLQEFEAKLSGELADIRSEFQDLRQRAEALVVPPPALPPPALPQLPAPTPVVAPPRSEVAERTSRLLEKVGRMQENLEQNMAAIERAREADFFFAVLNDLSGDSSAQNNAVTRIMVDEALKKASKAAQRQVSHESRPGPQGPRRGAKVDSGLRKRSISPARSPEGPAAALVEPLLRPGQLGNRRRSPVPYLHFANPLKEVPRSPALVRARERSPEDRARARGQRQADKAAGRPAQVKLKPKPKAKSKPRCRLLNFRQWSGAVQPPASEDQNTGESPSPRGVSPQRSEEPQDAEDKVSSVPSVAPPSECSRRSEEGTGVELPGWNRPAAPQKAHLAPRPAKKAALPQVVAKAPRDPLELRLRNRLEDEVIAEIVSQLGRQRDREIQTTSPDVSEHQARPASAQLRAAAQDVLLSEAMRMLQRSRPEPPLRPEGSPRRRRQRVPTPETTPKATPQHSPDATPDGPSEREPEEYSEEFEEEEVEEEEEELFDPEPCPPRCAASPPFSPRRDVFTPSWSLVSDEEERSDEAPAPARPHTPPLSPRATPQPRTPRQAHFAAQTQEEAGVQTAGVAEVQTDLPTPPSELSPAFEDSEDSIPPSESLMSDGQWLLDRSEGQHHELCVDWAMRRQLANAAMVRRGDLTDTSSVTADRTEEGEAVPSRRYDPERDFLMQLLLEQQKGATDPLEALLGGEVVEGPPSDFDALASMSIGQVPRPSPRMRRPGGDFSASTTINEEALEDSPVRDSGGSLPPGVTRVRESMTSTGELPTAALLGTQESQPAFSDPRPSDRMDVDLMRYLGGSMNTTTGTANSEDLTRTGMLSTNQLIQDALQTTDLSATGDGPTQPPQRRVKVTMPTLDAVPSSPSEDDISEISLKA